MTKLVKNGLIGKVLGLGNKDAAAAADSRRAEARNLQKISNDRAKSQIQADSARNTGSRRAKRGRRLLNEKRTTLG